MNARAVLLVLFVGLISLSSAQPSYPFSYNVNLPGLTNYNYSANWAVSPDNLTITVKYLNIINFINLEN